MKRKISWFRDALVTVSGTSVQCEERTCFLPGVVQIWVGKAYEAGFFESESMETGLNLELGSGAVYSFYGEEEDFLWKAYAFLIQRAAKGNYEDENYVINFVDGTIKSEEELENEKEEQDEARQKQEREDLLLANSSAASVPKPVVNYGGAAAERELKDLISYYRGMNEADPQVLPLLKEISGRMSSGRTEGIKELYQQFIGLSLIQTCNELGFNILIEEVKAHVYRT